MTVGASFPPCPGITNTIGFCKFWQRQRVLAAAHRQQQQNCSDLSLKLNNSALAHLQVQPAEVFSTRTNWAQLFSPAVLCWSTFVRAENSAFEGCPLCIGTFHGLLPQNVCSRRGAHGAEETEAEETATVTEMTPLGSSTHGRLLVRWPLHRQLVVGAVACQTDTNKPASPAAAAAKARRPAAHAGRLRTACSRAPRPGGPRPALSTRVRCRCRGAYVSVV